MEDHHAGARHDSGIDSQDQGLYGAVGQGARFALEGLTEDERRLVHGDSPLIFKMLGLFEMMKETETAGQEVAFLMEHPADPADYLDKAEEDDFPSVWDWPELKEFEKRFGLYRVKFDQGATGHVRRKPTTLCTSLEEMTQLQGLQANPRRSWKKSWRRDLPRQLMGSLVTGFSGSSQDGDQDLLGWKAWLSEVHNGWAASTRTSEPHPLPSWLSGLCRGDGRAGEGRVPRRESLLMPSPLTSWDRSRKDGASRDQQQRSMLWWPRCRFPSLMLRIEERGSAVTGSSCRPSSRSCGWRSKGRWLGRTAEWRWGLWRE